MIDDVFRAAESTFAEIEDATATHLAQVHHLAMKRRAIMRGLVKMAKANGARAPQAYVAQRLGISQQTVSKIINRK